MRQKKLNFRPYGLRARFVLTLVCSALACAVVFVGLYYTTDYCLTDYFTQSDFKEIHIERQAENLQNFIDENNISSEDLSQLELWEKRQPIILLELYNGDYCIYSSYNDGYNTQNESGYYEPDELDDLIEIELADMTVQAVLYSDFTYRYYTVTTVMAILISLIVFVLIFLYSNRKLIRYICRLNDEVQILEGGNLEYEVSVEGNDELTDLANSMNRMRLSFQQQMENEQQLYLANRKLITEMSHDLRTPLTGIMLYLEILRSHRYTTEEELQDYLEKIAAKAHHMKVISDHLFEYSLEHTAEKQAELMRMEPAVMDLLRDFRDELQARGYAVCLNLSWSPCFVQINREYMHRILENIASNIVKYSKPVDEIRVDSIDADGYSGFSVLNVCTPEDEPETVIESNGIGVESIRTMMNRMHGICSVEQTESVYMITLMFPKC